MVTAAIIGVDLVMRAETERSSPTHRSAPSL